MLAEKDLKDLELKKHVGSIHCSNTLSLLQRKISNVLLYHAYDELLVKDEHEIAIKTLCDLIGYGSHDYETIKKALKALISTVLEWNLLGDSKHNVADDWNASSILASVGIKSGMCTYSYSSHLKKLLYMPEIYGRINIAIQARFKSNYALALYENCIRYKNLPHTRWFALSLFRKLMGVPDEKYSIFRDFKRRVLDKSIAEINHYSDIVIEPEIEREGQKVQRIRFKLNQRAREVASAIQSSEAAGEGEALLQRLITLGVSEEQAKSLLSEYEEDFIVEKIDLIKNSHAYLHDRVHNIAAYLKSALRENYVSPKRKSVPTASVVTTDPQDRLKKGYADFISQKLDSAFEQSDEATQLALQKQFEDNLLATHNSFVLEKFYNKGMSNRIVKSMFRTFLKEQQDALGIHIETLEEFIRLTNITY